MKYLKYPLFILALFAFVACSDDSTDEELVGNWVKSSDFNGVARSEASYFVIGSKGYLCMGYTGKKHLNDLWEFDSDKKYWTQKASLPDSVKRSSAAAFAIGTVGYVVSGNDGENYLTDVWAYSQETDSWTKKSDIKDPNATNPSAVGFTDAIAFSIGDKGYILQGYNGSYSKDFWTYDPNSDSWTKSGIYSGSKRMGGSVFVIDGKAYVCCGMNNGSYLADVWMFDPSTGEWTPKNTLKDVSSKEFDNDYASVQRVYGSAFVINGKGYISCGAISGITSDTWEYDPANDTWTQKSPFEGTARVGTCVFSFGDKAFVVTGRNSTQRFDDCWEFRPNDEANEND